VVAKATEVCSPFPLDFVSSFVGYSSMRWSYDPHFKAFARILRGQMTLGEVLLWQQLNKGQRGADFHRQKPVDRFILDFFAPRLALAIEFDGSTHDFKISQDQERQARLESLGIHFLRFTGREVRDNLDGVVAVIDDWIKTRSQG
jgi:very-short-patch-repair endonuclease